MCGIYGAIRCGIKREKAEVCLNQLKHRGPDGWGLYQYEDIILGHRRLSILDLSENGKQPMECIGGRYVITFNGEIYNFLEIREELKKIGYRFWTDTDTEVIPAAYDAWGEDCLNKFNGMWAFGLYDREKKTFFGARDRFGIKPFLYTQPNGNNSLAFASEMKALVPLLKKKDINYDIISNDIVFQYESTENCLIKQIKRLPAGHSMRLDQDGLTINRWWNTLDNIPDIPTKYEEQVELFRELFIDACKLRMRSDVTLGTALSGGVDSSATICTMAEIARNRNGERINKDWHHAFVAAFPETTLDESQYARVVTDYLGIDSTFINIDPSKYISEFENELFLFEEIYLTTPIPMMATYKSVKDHGVTVTLDGHGADELFGGYSFDLFTAFPDAKFRKKNVDEILCVYSEMFPHDGSNLDRGNFEKRYDIYLNYMFWYEVSKLKRGGENFGCFDANHPNWKKLGQFNRRLYVETHQTTLPTLLRNYDHYSMANGVEIRMPFMDYRLVTMAFALNWNSKLRNGYSKAIIRDALKAYMPKAVVERKTKIGFNTPIVEWMQGAMKEYFEDVVSELAFVNSDVVDAKLVRSKILAVTRAEKGTVSFDEAETAYSLLAPYLWEKCFFKREII